MMKLYTSPNSPFSARIRIAALAKGLVIPDAQLPPGGLKSAAFLALNPIAKIPVLALDDGRLIPESTAILRYLEDRFPQPSLMPADSAERARVNVVVRIMEAYVMDPVVRLFSQLDPARRDAAVVEREVARWTDGADYLAEALAGPLPEAEAGLSLADCVLAPSIHLSVRIAALLGLAEDPLRRRPAVAAYERRIRGHVLVGPVIEALTASQHAYDLKAGRPSVAQRHQTHSFQHPSPETTT